MGQEGSATRSVGAIASLGFLMTFLRSCLFLSRLLSGRASPVAHRHAFSLFLGSSPVESGRIVLFPPSNLVVDLQGLRRLLSEYLQPPQNFLGEWPVSWALSYIFQPNHCVSRELVGGSSSLYCGSVPPSVDDGLWSGPSVFL